MFDSSTAPGSWSPWSARPELAPQCECDGEYWFVEAGSGPGNHGGWDLFWFHIRPGESYRLDVACKAVDVPNHQDNVRAEVIWWTKDGKRADWTHVRSYPLERGVVEFAYEGQAPADADHVTLRLSLRWTARGKTAWCDPRLVKIRRPPPRKIVAGVATGEFPGTSVEANVGFACDLIARAAHAGAHVVCLPECITTWRGKGLENEGARPIPGAETQTLCEAARQNAIDVVCSINEVDRQLIYNTGLYIDSREGLIGKYRKVHLAVGERWSGVTPGDVFPVWQARYGKVGMLICYDNVHGEGHRILSQKGAEVLFMPIMGDPRAVGGKAKEIWRRIMSVRAMDNHVWFVVCRNRGEWGCVIRPDGEIVASLDSQSGVAVAELDLSFRHDSWIGSNFENRYWGERRPHLYGELSEDS